MFEPIRAPGGGDARLYVPEGPGPWPRVVLLMDAGGLRPSMDALATAFAAAGTAVIAPNLYWRSEPFAPIDFRTAFSVPAESERVRALMRAIAVPDVVADLAGWYDWPDPRLRPGPVGLVGYCMGGRLAVLAAAAAPDRVVAAAAIHPGGLVTDGPTSPHLGVGTIRAQLYIGAADEDNSFTAAHRATLAAALDAAGTRYELDFQPGARHGYAVEDAPVYSAAADARHRDKVTALFRSSLGA
ncbi:MAG: dienelactone hydrolase family protein [Myxococcota bacterium]